MHLSTKDKSILVVGAWWPLCQNYRSIAYLRNVCAPKRIIIFLLRVANRCRQTDRLLGFEANSQLTHRRALFLLFSILSISGPNEHHPSPFFSEIYLLLDDAVATVSTSMGVYSSRRWLAFLTSGNGDDPVLVHTAKTEVPGKCTDDDELYRHSVGRETDNTDPHAYILILAYFWNTCTFRYPVFFIVCCGEGILPLMVGYTKMHSNNNEHQWTDAHEYY